MAAATRRRATRHSYALPRTLSCAGAFSLAFGVATTAFAQVHYDGEVDVGITHRVATAGTGPHASEVRSFGPMIQVAGDVALMPLVRTGLWGSWDMSANQRAGNTAEIGGTGRNWVSTFGGGARIRILSPILLGPLRPALTTGLGWSVGVAHRDGTAGGSLDIPLALSFALKLRKPWELNFTVGSRFSVYHTGKLFNGSVEDAAVHALPSRDYVMPYLAVGLHTEL